MQIQDQSGLKINEREAMPHIEVVAAKVSGFFFQYGDGWPECFDYQGYYQHICNHLFKKFDLQNHIENSVNKWSKILKRGK